jgi:hypothetical protein
MNAAGTFFAFKPTNVGDAGAGVLDQAFLYPFMKPAMSVEGPGNYCGSAPRSTFIPSYFNQTTTPLSAQGGGVIQGNLAYTPLLTNFYGPTNPAL